MGLRKQAFIVVVMVLTGMALASCGAGSDSAGGPTSPSQQQIVSGTNAPAPTPSATSVRVEGTVSGFGGTCPVTSFVVGNARIRTSAETQFRGIACPEIRNGTFVEVDGLRQADGSLLAREIELENEAPAPPPPGGNPVIEVEGLIQNLAGSCPDITFVVAARPVRALSATQFSRIPCALLQNGMDVEIDGVLDASGVLVAREVQPDEVDLIGTVAAVTGACPDSRFGVDGTAVVAFASTRFDDLSCATLREGIRVEVRGVRRADGTLLLTRVKLRVGNQGPGNQEQRVEGALTALEGACPSRSFSVSGRRVITTASTRFDDTTCAGLQSGMQVEVRGSSQANGSIEATRVSRKG